MWLPEGPAWQAGLSAQQLTLVRRAPWWSGKGAAYESVPCAPADAAQAWRPVLAALERRLAEHTGRAPVLHTVLSGRFVRWQLLPWRSELTQPQELAAYAALRFRETFGAVATQWQILYAAPAPGRPVAACAVDLALLEALRGVCTQAGARLAAVTPYFSAAFGHWRGALDRKAAWFGVLEPDHVSLGLLQGGQWRSLCSQRRDTDWRQLLPRLMAQAGIPAGMAGATPPLYLAGVGDALASDASLPFSGLQPRSADAARGCRMALGL